MIRIFKYEIPPVYHAEVSLPKDAEILFVGNQNEKVCLWARVEENAPLETRRFIIAYTGHIVESDELKYLNTVLLSNGNFVFHVFEVLEATA